MFQIPGSLADMRIHCANELETSNDHEHPLEKIYPVEVSNLLRLLVNCLLKAEGQLKT